MPAALPACTVHPTKLLSTLPEHPGLGPLQWHLHGGDLHYVTFDGNCCDYGSGCFYEFTGTCEVSRKLVGFQVLVQDEARGLVSFTCLAWVIVYGYNFTFSQDFPRKAWRGRPQHRAFRRFWGGDENIMEC